MSANSSATAKKSSDDGRSNYEKGYTFEDRVAEAYRLLGYQVQHGRLFSGRQVDIFLELNLGDLQIRRAVECKAGEVTVEDLDRFLLKLDLVQREYPDSQGTVVGGLGFTDSVTSHATAKGVKLTLFRDLSAQILDGPAYATTLIREIDSNERYIPKLFVEPSISYDSTGKSRPAFAVLDEWLKDAQWSQLTLLGDVGTGKSFLCRMLARKLAQEYLESPSDRPLPLLIDLRNADREFSLEGLILTHFATHSLSRATFGVFNFLTLEGRLILIFDGFDEMASRVTPVITTRNFHELARCVKRNAKVLLTCRTHYFKSRTEEEEVVLGGSGQTLSEVARDLYWDLISRNGFKIAYLQPFTLRHIEEYVSKACGESAHNVLAKIHKIYNLAELSQRPLLLEMIVKSVDRLTTTEINSAQLYEIFTNAWVHRDRWRDVMQPEEKLRFLKTLARSLWEEEKTSINYQDLQTRVSDDLAALIDEPRTLIELDAEVRTASFLVRDARGNYGFAHSSYAEYFLAKYLAEEINTNNLDALVIRRLTNEVIDFLLRMVRMSELETLLTAILLKPYQQLLSENALLILYRLRRNLLIEERGRGEDTHQLAVEMPVGLCLQGAKLAQVGLEGAILRSADLQGADLRQSVAAGADFTNSDLRAIVASKADLHGTCFRNVDATNAILCEVNLEGADVGGCNFERADLSGALLMARNIKHAIFHETLLRSTTLPPETELEISSTGKVFDPDSPHRSMEHSLEQVRRIAEKFAKTTGAWFDAEDVASEVVLHLLSRPGEIDRLRQMNPKTMYKAVGALILRFLSSSQREAERLEISLDALRRQSRFDFQAEDDSDSDFITEEELLDTILASANIEEWTSVSANDESIDQSPLMPLLKKALTEDALRILVARYVAGKSIKEIAEVEGTTEMQIARRLNKARELARSHLRVIFKRAK
jgi:RNA polymerase sigma factor (sigma-70 family)